jgi:hypothetical protein
MKALINMGGVVDNDIGNNEFCVIVVRERWEEGEKREKSEKNGKISSFFWTENEGEWRRSERMEMGMVPQ